MTHAPPTRRRWFQLNLRDVLFIVTLVAVGAFGIQQRSLREYERQQGNTKIQLLEKEKAVLTTELELAQMVVEVHREAANANRARPPASP